MTYLPHKLFFQNSFYTIIIFNFCSASASPNKDEALHGRHDAHKHHDTMGEVNLV